MTIERYRHIPDLHDKPHAKLVPDENGHWVRFEDHQRLLQARDKEFDEATQELATELADARREAGEAESKLSSVVEELERRADAVTYSPYPEPEPLTDSESARLGALREAAQLLRDKGTEQGGGDGQRS